MIKTQTKHSTRRRVYPSWSIELPRSFRETFVTEGGYWHAYDLDHSVSLTSMELTDRGRPVPARSVVRRMRPPKGDAIDVLPPGLLGWGVFGDADADARASRRLSGMLAIDGRVLITTITSDDLAWLRTVWLSIRAEVVPIAGNRSDPRSTDRDGRSWWSRR